MSPKILVLFCFFLATALTQFTNSDVNYIKSFILNNQNTKSGLFFDDTASTRKSIEILKKLKVKIPNVSSICKELQHDVKDKLTSDLIIIDQLLECNFRFESAKDIDFTSDSSLETLYEKIKMLYLTKKESKLEESYTALKKFYSKNKFSLKKEAKNKSLYGTGLGLELMGMIYESSSNSTKKEIKAELKEIVNSIQSSLTELSKDTSIYTEKNVPIYKLNAQIITALEKIKDIITIPKYDTLLSQILNYFIQFKYEIYSLDNIKNIFVIFTSAEKIPIITLDKTKFNYVEDKDLEVKFVNAFGKPLKLDNLNLLYKVTPFKEEEKKSLDIEEEGEDKFKSKKGISESSTKIDLKGIVTKPGRYNCVLLLKNKKAQVSSKEFVLTSISEIKIEHLKIEIENSLDSSNSEAETTVEYPKRSFRNFKANQESILKLKIKLSYGDKQPNKVEQIFLRLKHSELGKVFSAYSTKFDEETGYYFIGFAMDDPVNMESYNGVYEMTLIVSDRELEIPLLWNFGKISITFLKPNDPSMANPTYKNQLKPKMLPTFSSETSLNKSPIASLVFSALIGLTGFGLITVLTSLKYNVSNFGGSSYFYSLLFIVFTLLLCYIMFLFWIKLNILQTLGIFVLLFIPGVIIVYQAMKNTKIDI